jgi:Uma2 family endonuclease
MATGLRRESEPDALNMLLPEEMPCVDHLVTEDDTPLDSFFAEKQQRLWTEPLYSSWPGPGEGRRFVAAANVGIFYTLKKPPLVPDAFLSLDVEVPDDLFAKNHRSYFIWEYEKPPDAALEIVSDTRGDEEGFKFMTYAKIGILYYVIWDPKNILRKGPLRVFVLRDKAYVPLEKPWLPVVGLGLTTWEGSYEGSEALWLRWCDERGTLIPTGAERAGQERQRTEQERQRADQERQRADQERQRADQERSAKEGADRRAERLAAQIRALGLEPET